MTPLPGAHRRIASIPRRLSDVSLDSRNEPISLAPIPASPIMLSSPLESESPYSAATRGGKGFTKTSSISSKYSLHADPAFWGSNLNPKYVEADDSLHNPTVRGGKVIDDVHMTWSFRGFANLGCLLVLCLAILTLFVGYPAISFGTKRHDGATPMGVNASGQVPQMANGFSLIDPDTPADARTKKSWRDGVTWQLVFSDEFNTDGRTFYPGEDPYWEADDLHYWGTNNMEWYDPAALTTADGSLIITLSEKETHDLHYQGGLMTTWNKFCFTGGLIETSVQLPGIANIVGLWPAVWTMGNLGRAGYGASLEGMWPYTYDDCDVGTAPNQTINGRPEAALTSGWDDADYHLSYLPGQKLSRCTCPGSDHPGPMHSDGTYVGRSAPEIDIIEAQVTAIEEGDPLVGQVSQSGQFAPFNENYTWDNVTHAVIFDPTISVLNGYKGGKTQQAGSVVTNTDPNCYQLGGTDCFSVYGFEYKAGYDDSYIQWISDNKAAWRLNGAGMGPDPAVEISQRPIPQEPMYLIVNLGMSTNFGDVDLEHLTFPAIMRIDWIRVYQDPKHINVGCDPSDFPTKDYIETYIEAYTNPNLTTWRDDYGQAFPKNSLVDGCD